MPNMTIRGLSHGFRDKRDLCACSTTDRSDARRVDGPERWPSAVVQAIHPRAPILRSRHHAKILMRLNALGTLGTAQTLDFKGRSVSAMLAQRVLGTIEQRRTGWTIAQATAGKLVRDLRRKAKEGFQQIASDGTVVCVAWCDFVGVVLAKELAGFRVTGSDIFEGHCYIVGARNEVGRDLWFGFPTNKEWERTLCGLHASLNTRRYRPLPFGDPGVKFATNAKDWMSMGRIMRIDGSRQHEN